MLSRRGALASAHPEWSRLWLQYTWLHYNHKHSLPMAERGVLWLVHTRGCHRLAAANRRVPSQDSTPLPLVNLKAQLAVSICLLLGCEHASIWCVCGWRICVSMPRPVCMMCVCRGHCGCGCAAMLTRVRLCVQSSHAMRIQSN
jgi:hypothetical protein